MSRRTAVFGSLLLLAGCGSSRDGVVRHRLHESPCEGPRVLCVVAHPDDEIAFAATLFKTATHLRGCCDMVVITNGEAGYKYSTLGALHYGLDLTDPDVGRARLPAIRQREHLSGARLLGLRRITYLNQRDHRYTKDPAEVLAPNAGVWNLATIEAELRKALASAKPYDFVLTHLPSAETHGHHQAATILALRAVRALPRDQRPVILGAYPATRRGEEPPPSPRSDEYPITRIRRDIGAFRFDRAQKFGFRDRLDYQIVVNWAIAEHKSQGSFQTLGGRWDLETFRVFEISPPDAEARAGEWFDALAEPQFDSLHYDEDGERQLDPAAGVESGRSQ